MAASCRPSFASCSRAKRPPRRLVGRRSRCSLVPLYSSNGHLMKWIAGALLVLVIAILFGFDLLAYAMYVLLAVLLVSRFLTRNWAESLAATRDCNKTAAEVGENVAVVVTVKNSSRWPVAWVLLEDLLPRDALLYE